MSGISTWFEGVIELINEKVKEMLIECCTKLYDSLFVDINTRINAAGGILNQSPADWSSSTFGTIQRISEVVIVPVAALIITYVFCYEIISLVTEANSMKTIKISDIMTVLIKTSIAIMVFTNSFKIVMAFFDVGNFVTRNITVPSMTVSTIDISNILASESIVSLCGAVILLLATKAITFLISIAIFFAINAWFLEIYIYSSIAAIPFATFMNKEWGQIGYNYTRRIMALAFQSFFMLLCLVVYSTQLHNVGSGDLTDRLIEILGGSLILTFMLFKCGNISNSIFNAH